MNPPTQLLVAHHQRWVYDDMVAGATGRWPVHQLGTHRLPPPDTSDTTAWWTTTGHAARLVAAHLPLTLTCIPADWLSRLPTHLTGRTITTRTLADTARQPPHPGFLKPALAKTDLLHPRWHEDVPAAAQSVLTAGAHPHTATQVADRLLDIDHEWRTYILNHQACTPSPYLTGGQPWEPHFDRRDDLPHADAHRYAQHCADTLAELQLAPDAYVLDIAHTRDGRWHLLEANAPWAANPYGCHLPTVVDTVVRSSTPPCDPRWRWHPDPEETRIAHNLPPLTPPPPSRH